MLQKRLQAAQEVLPVLRSAETTIDDAIGDSARLVISIMEARRKAGLSLSFGAEAVDCAGVYFSTLMQARKQIIVTHEKLAETRDQMGLATRMSGGVGDKPNFDTQSHLAVVA